MSSQEITFVTAEGNKYVGQPWIDDVPVVGSIFYSFGARYQGELLNGQPHGYGQMTSLSLSSAPQRQPPTQQNHNNLTSPSSNTIIYDGEWKLGLRSGTGRLRRYAKGVASTLLYQFEGGFLNDLTHGSGVESIYFSSSTIVNSNNNNHSKPSAAAGATATTQSSRMSFLYHLANEGKLETRYTGTFSSGLRCGHGLLEDFVRGKITEGEFRENLPWGHVIIRWTKDNTAEHLRSFDGEFVNGEMHGKGTLIMRNGEIFRGIFKNNKRSEGIITDGDGASHQRKAKYDDENGMLVSFEDVESGSRGGVFLENEKSDDNAKNEHHRLDEPKSNNNNNNLIKSVDALHAKIEFPNGDYFIGETLLGRAHGKGKLHFFASSSSLSDGAQSQNLQGGCYEGDFEDGLFHGFGKLLRTQYSRKINFLNNNSNNSKISSSCGTGEKIFPANKDQLLFSCWRYEGKFSAGFFHGFGRYWDFESGGFYEGSFVHGAMNGVGKFIYNNNDNNDAEKKEKNGENIHVAKKYEGEFFDNQPCGAGAKWYSDRVIRGHFENGKCCCLEENAAATGTIEYFGKVPRFTTTTNRKNSSNNIENENAHVERSLLQVKQALQALTNNSDATSPIASEEVGVRNISDNISNGKNDDDDKEDTFATDQVVATYVGGIFQDKRHGTGEMRYENGDVYFGEFECDKRHGVGILTSSNSNSVYEGKFVNDRPHGPCSVKNLETNTILVGSAVLVEGLKKNKNNNNSSYLSGVISDANGFEKQILVAP